MVLHGYVVSGSCIRSRWHVPCCTSFVLRCDISFDSMCDIHYYLLYFIINKHSIMHGGGGGVAQKNAIINVNGE